MTTTPTAAPTWQTTRFEIDLAQPRVMGIVNVTPDSFSDGGQHATLHAAVQHCEQLLKDGADMLDIGGESSRPGAQPLPLTDELARVIPLVREAVRLNVPISVDTYKAEVMQAALDAGADIVNDIWAFRQPGAAQVVLQHGRCGLVMMHMHREPASMQITPMDGTDVVARVKRDLLSFQELLTRILYGLTAQKALNLQQTRRVLIDPGIGFGKTVPQNFTLLARQRELLSLGYPILAGWSRKSSLGAVTGLDVEERLVPSVAAAVLAVERGASVVRVHDVRETVAALKVWQAMKQQDHQQQDN
jgi:dihydropteroate synthase